MWMKMVRQFHQMLPRALAFTRTATINAETGAIVSHSDWQPVTTDTFDAVTSPSIDDLYTTQKTIDAVTVKADADRYQ
jgi:hypothetical protein